MMRNISILYMYKHALHDCNSHDVKATPNHTHHLTWPHPLPGLTTSELPEPPLTETQLNISLRVQVYIPGFLLTLLITSTFFFYGLLVGALDITHYSTWTTKIHCQQFNTADLSTLTIWSCDTRFQVYSHDLTIGNLQITICSSGQIVYCR